MKIFRFSFLSLLHFGREPTKSAIMWNALVTTCGLVNTCPPLRPLLHLHGEGGQGQGATTELIVIWIINVLWSIYGINVKWLEDRLILGILVTWVGTLGIALELDISFGIGLTDHLLQVCWQWRPLTPCLGH
jgi:hypothetical protein